MPPKKKRRSQRTAVRHRPEPENPSGSDKRVQRRLPRIADEVNRKVTDGTTGLMLDEPSSHPSEGPPLVNNVKHKELTAAAPQPLRLKRVQTPPRARGSIKPSRTPHRSEPRAAGVTRTAASIPIGTESNDDCEVLPVHRVPIDENPFYQKFLERQDARDFSPITPTSIRRSGDPIADEIIDQSEHQRHGPVRRALGTFSSEGSLRGQEESADGDDYGADIRMLTVSNEMMSSFCKRVEESLAKEFVALRRHISERFEGIENKHDRITTEINELRVVFSGGKGGSAQNFKETPLAVYETKLDQLTPHADWTFDLNSICRTLRMNLPHFILSMSEERGALIDNVSMALRAVLFGLLPSQKRSVYSTGVGRKHSAFRYSVVMNILCNVQQNSFGRFNDKANANGGACLVVDDQQVNDQAVVRPIPEQGEIGQPAWLMPNFICSSHVDEARIRLESVVRGTTSAGQHEDGARRKGRNWITAKDVPDKRDIARFGASKAYRFVSTGLYYAREKAKWVLFEELTYIMINWEKEVKDSDVSQRSLRVLWGHEDEDVTKVDLDDVPTSKKRRTHPEEADEQNTSMFAEFLSSRKEMVLCVVHDVSIKCTGSPARSGNNGNLKLRRMVNIIDVAMKFYVTFTEQSVGTFSPLQFLGAHTGSLKCIYGVAIVLRRIVQAFIQECMSEDSYVVTADTEDPPNVHCHGVNLNHLLPAASVPKRLLSNRCLRMTKEDFDRFRSRPGGNEDLEQPVGEDDEGVIGIDPSNIDGVMLL